MDDVPETAAAKVRLRAALLAARRERGAVELERARTAVADHVVAAARVECWRTVAAYEPMRTEPGSLQLLARLTELGIDILVPVTLPGRDLDWARWPSAATNSPGGAAGPTKLGLEAIAGAQAVLVPALAVALDGTRLGRGGGSYDRALLRCPAGTRRLALVFDGEVRDDVPAHSWDVAVDAAITPSGLVELGRPHEGNTAVTFGD